MSKIYLSMLLIILSSTVIAAPMGFSKGPVFGDYGSNIIIAGGIETPESQEFKVVFDISEHDEKGQVSRKLDTVARFINMHVRAGVPLKNLDLAIVVHGKAGFDLMSNAAHQVKFDKANPNEELLNSLLDADVKVFVCGQSSSFLGVAKKDLNPRVKMSLSAMTANALLQQQGYTLNPF
jgi:intracellular sulfur oxidation DsrE/DsrF family protein